MNSLDFSVITTAFPALLQGALGTMGLAVAAMLMALVIGLVGVVLRQSRFALVRGAVIAFVEVIRNTPLLVQLFFIFFALPLIGLKLAPTGAAIIALGVNGGAYAIEIIRGGVESIHTGQLEAGRALGLQGRDVFRFVVLKPALRAIYPALTSQFIMLTLASSVCTSISAFELTSVAQRIESETFRSFEVYFSITLMYLAISTLLMLMFRAINRHYFNYPR